MENTKYTRKVCGNCPFRKDSPKGWLGSDRMSEILNSEIFHCHKTTSATLGKNKTNQICAGHLALSDRSFAKRIGYTAREADLKLLFKTQNNCIKHHEIIN
ncbi:hypothetical protein MS2017_1343 [Bathymodiolus thermophilus thioautotrophic gill symbiont]|uniref:Uncharacterized protein n=1 Tax=Bathymodiolus thermophilus thioautotrophic gill symbiont TaxID=2360 RepID=A0A3G3IMH7_9GAMM|nr:DUF6283 family protein [Bathymodiolus thermophilus thioautotrophic gill symbiont]AYQ57033.1 hypothetical protein MS2017_1343 [Bathymodiolus thermophilus thioautotrophic gill symbiont]